MAIDALQLYDELLAAFPNGFVQSQDLDHPDGFGPELRAIAELLKTSGTDLVDQLRRNATPLLADAARLAEWEETLGQRPRPSASVDQRRLAIASRLRERGPCTYALVRAVLGPLLDYADPSQLEILEVDRDVLRAAHTYAAPGLPAAPPFTASIDVLDDAKIGEPGVQLDILITTTNLAALGVQITSPDGKSVNKLNFARGGGLGQQVRVYAPELAGAQAGGTWTVLINSMIPGTSILAVQLFAEGVGRTSVGGDGLGAVIFEWVAVADPAKMGSLADLQAARDALARINYATRRGALIVKPTAMTYAPYPDTPLAIPNLFIPG